MRGLNVFRVLEVAAALGEFTVADLVARTGINAGTVRSTLDRNGEYLFPKQTYVRSCESFGCP
jgi:hypothetical protein